MIITPDKYAETPTYDLLDAIARGRIGFDQRVLRVILDRGNKAVPDLVRWGTEDHDDLEYDLSEELISIFRHLQTPEAVPFFIDYIRQNPLDVSEDLPDAMYGIQAAAVEPLLKLYEELEEEEGAEVAFLLASFRIRDERILRILVDRLEYDAIDGAIDLGLYGDPAARPALEKMLAEIPEDEVHVRRNLEDALAELGARVDEQRQEWNIWDEFPEKAQPELEVLPEDERLEYLAAPDPEYRIAAAASFLAIDLSDKAQIALLNRAQSDDDARVRGKCWEALSDEIEDKKIRSAMLARLEDESVPPEERQGALLGLASEAANAPVRAYVERFYANDQMRAAALKAMWGSMDRSFAPYFPKHLDDPDTEVKKQAIAGVGYLAVHDASEKLQKFFDDDDLRANALFAYALSTRHEISRGRVRALFRKVEDAAGGLNEEEEQLVQIALDQRLLMHGQQPVFYPETEADEEEEVLPPLKVGRNDPCPCGSGKKYKKCCGAS